MSNIVPFTQHQALQAAQDMAAIVADNFSDGGGISFKDLTRFKLGAGGATLFTRVSLGLSGKPEEEHLKSFRAIVIERRTQRAYWPQAYGEGGSAAPDCKSVDGVHGDGDNGVAKGRHACATCPRNQFGTKVGKGGVVGAGKACREVRVFFLIAEGTEGLFPSVLIVPPGSLGNLTRHMAALTNARKRFSDGVHSFALEKAKSDGGTDFAVLRLAWERDQTAEEKAEVQRYYQAMHPLLSRFYEQSAAEAPEAVEQEPSSAPVGTPRAAAPETPIGAEADEEPVPAATGPEIEPEFEIVKAPPKAAAAPAKGRGKRAAQEMFPDPADAHQDPA